MFLLYWKFIAVLEKERFIVLQQWLDLAAWEKQMMILLVTLSC